MVALTDDSLNLLGHIIAGNTDPLDVPDDVWPVLIALAQQQGVAGMLFWRMKQDAAQIATGPQWDALQNGVRMLGLQLLFMEQAQFQVADALNEAGIPNLWLKGSVLLRTVYPQPSLRPMGDLDVLVPFAQREAALQIAQNLGYHFHDDPTRQLNTFSSEAAHHRSHHYHLWGTGQFEGVVLELHYGLLNKLESLLSAEQFAWFWTQTENYTVEGHTLLKLRDEAHLLYLCAHALLQHSEDDLSLRRLLDVHMLIDQADLDWDLVVGRAAMLHWGGAVQHALTLVQSVFGTAVPHDVLRQLDATDASSLGMTLRTGLGARWYAVQLKLREESPKEAARFFWYIACPPPGYMRDRYQVPHKHLVWFYYPYRWAYQLGSMVSWAVRRVWLGLRR